MKFECYRDWHQLPKGVDALFEHCSHESMFLTREWFETLYAKTVEQEQPLLLVCVIDGDSVLALLPLTESVIQARRYGEAFKHRYTALYSLLLAEERQTEVLVCLAEGLNRKPVHSLSLSPVAENDHNILSLQKVLSPYGFEYNQHFFFYNWIHRVKQQSFDEYMAERPTKLRNTIARKQRKLEREQTYSIRMFKANEVQQGLKDYHAAYTASWKAHEQYVSLLDAVAINLSVPGWTRLAVLYINGEAAAAQLWFVVNGKASIFRLAYDEKWKRYSTGSILTAYLMRYVIDIDKVEEIDFLTGNEVYKQDWMSERRVRHRVSFVQPRQPQSRSDRLMAKIKQGFAGLFKESLIKPNPVISILRFVNTTSM